MVATFFHRDSWYELGRPTLPYTEYRYRNGRSSVSAPSDANAAVRPAH